MLSFSQSLVRWIPHLLLRSTILPVEDSFVHFIQPKHYFCIDNILVERFLQCASATPTLCMFVRVQTLLHMTYATQQPQSAMTKTRTRKEKITWKRWTQRLATSRPVSKRMNWFYRHGLNTIYISAPRVSCMEFGTIFSTFAGRPSCNACGTLESPVACDTLPVSLLLLVSCAESGTWCSMLEGTYDEVLVEMSLP